MNDDVSMARYRIEDDKGCTLLAEVNSTTGDEQMRSSKITAVGHKS